MAGDKRILYVCKEYQAQPSGGREMLSALNYQVLKRIYQDNFFNFEISSYVIKRTKTEKRVKIFNGEIDGISPAIIKKLLDMIHQQEINQLFIDGSNLGLIAQSVKKIFPDVKIYTFFHNVEAKFFYDSFLRKKTFRALAILIANYFAEKKSALYSNHIICLTDVDSVTLQKIYGVKADSVSAIALNDSLPHERTYKQDMSHERYVLFVGGLFYANEYGVRWFAKNVAAKIKFKTYIVGRGFEALRAELEVNDNIKVLGEVDDLSEIYFYASYIIAPIFDGSGMKTKVAEAFMFGKKILATDAALVGYNDVPVNAYHACNTKEDFINVLNHAANKGDHNFDQSLRSIYQQEFSSEAAQLRLEKILLKS